MNQTFIMAASLSMLAGYLIGSISFAIIISKIVAGDDVRAHGSNNAGATNVLRTYGKVPAILTFTLDIVKGCISVFVAKAIFSYLGAEDLGGYFGGFGALLGHIFPLYFGLKGGKGMATGLGCLLAIEPLAFLIVSIIFVPLVPITGYVSLAAVIGASSFPFVLAIVRYFQGRFSLSEFIVAVGLAAILVYTHRQNIGRLIQGTERKISFRGKEKKE